MITITHYQTASQFWDKAGTYLSQREARHNLIIGVSQIIAAREKKSPDQERHDYWGVIEDGNTVIGAAMITPPYNVDIGYIDGDQETITQALTLLAKDIFEGGWDPPGVSSDVDTAQEFATLWTSLSGKAHKPGMEQRIYQLTGVIPPAETAGLMQAATRDDTLLLREWITAFYQEALEGHEPGNFDVDEIITHIFEDDHRDLYFWKVDGQSVSMAASTGPTPRGKRVNLVYTPPEHRQQGYASAVVAALSQKLLDEGRDFCFLFTDLSNPTSNHIYSAIGYEPVGDIRIIRFEEQTIPPDN